MLGQGRGGQCEILLVHRFGWFFFFSFFCLLLCVFLSWENGVAAFIKHQLETPARIIQSYRPLTNKTLFPNCVEWGRLTLLRGSGLFSYFLNWRLDNARDLLLPPEPHVPLLWASVTCVCCQVQPSALVSGRSSRIYTKLVLGKYMHALMIL